MRSSFLLVLTLLVACGAPAREAPDAGACGLCQSGEFCSSRQTCCQLALACGNDCCDPGSEVCLGAVCHPACDGDPGRLCGPPGAEVCCAAGQVCASGGCFTPTLSCEDSIDCPEDQYCELEVDGGRCLPQPGGAVCQARPMGSEVMPQVVWHWDGSGAVQPAFNQVMMTPLVANLDDDNHDGIVDLHDTPDVVFTSYSGGDYQTSGILRAVRGDSGAALWDATASELRVNPGGQLAIGDLDGDGLVEIVACRAMAGELRGKLIAFRHDGSLMWVSSSPDIRCGQAAPAIADLDGDGQVEVFVRYGVVDGASGAQLGFAPCSSGETAPDHAPCDYTTAADLDGDRQLELVGGNVAYRFSRGSGLTALWDFRASRHDGYPAVADLDGNGTPEVVVVQSDWGDRTTAYHGDHAVLVLDGATGRVRAAPADLNDPVFVPLSEREVVNGGSCAPDGHCGVGGGGPPTIGNFDGDAQPEVAMAGAFNYSVFDLDPAATSLSRRWSAQTDDSSSRKTGSSLFDFDGDGTAEVVYADQHWLRVYDGPTGNVRTCACNTSGTLWEYPVIADVDSDGAAELVVAANDALAGSTSCVGVQAADPCTQGEVAAGRTAGVHGVRVFRGPGQGWVRTRRIWNQHGYHVTNVSELGKVPAHEVPNWSVGSLNNFRLNVQPGASNQPNLVPLGPAVGLNQCPHLTLYVEVHNLGWSAVAAGVPVTFYVKQGGAWQPVGTTSTTRALFPGQSELVAVDHVAEDGSTMFAFRAVVNDPGDGSPGPARECVADDDAIEFGGTCITAIP